MTIITKRQRQAKLLRIVRKVHRWTGASLFVIFLFISTTGLLLGWKKNSNGYLLPPTQQGTSLSPADWQSIDLLQHRALFLLDSIDPSLDIVINRIDVRPSKGIAKFTFKKHYQEIQLDLSTAQLLSYRTRRSDWLEQVHDGSILDKYRGTRFIKLIYTSLAGVALLIFTITGFWLWYGPKHMRKRD